MDYQKHYDILVQRAKTRTLGGYKECHHVVPKCIGGSNHKDNLVDLTPEEHYIAHVLLAKIYPHVPPIINAAAMMACRNNKNYGWVMRKYAIIASERFKGKPKSIEQRKKQSESKKQVIEYKGKMYKGFDELKEHTNVSYHLYRKYYTKGIDPEQYICNNVHGIIASSRTEHPRAAANKKWYNNGSEERYSSEPILGWTKGRLWTSRGKDGKFKKELK